jgi:iron complex transport system permease protein
MIPRLALALFGTLAVGLLSLFVVPGLADDHDGFILWQLRVPRLLVGLLVGGSLGLVGAAFQALFQNDLATPSTVGTTAGATLGALLSLVFGIGGGVSGLPVTVLFAFAGAMAASLLVASVALEGRARVGDVLLAGIAVTLATSAVSQMIQSLADMRALFSAVQWSLGQLPQLGFDGVELLTPFCVVSAVVVLSQTRSLQSLALGDEVAHSQGVAVSRVRALVLAGGSLSVAACVAWCGPIAFVGLIVPHLVRRTFGAALRIVLPLSMVLGGGFLVVCDLVGRVVWPGNELPVGVLTASLGAPALFVLITKGRR